MVSITPVKRILGCPVYIYVYVLSQSRCVPLQKNELVMSDWKPNVLRGYLEIGAYSYLLRFQCIGNTIPILSFTTVKISYYKKWMIICLKICYLK